MLLLLQTAAAADTLFIGVTDTTSLTATEDPVTEFSSDVFDPFSITITDTAAVAVNVSRGEDARLNLVEVAVVTIASPVSVAGTDTASLTLTESVVVDVAIPVTDTTSLTLSGEVGTVDVASESIAGTDTASITLTEASAIDKRDFNAVDFVDIDDAAIHLEEIASLTKSYPVSRAKFKLGAWSIKFRIRH